MKVVIFAPSGADPSQVLADLRSVDSTTIVRWGSMSASDSREIVVVPNARISRLVGSLSSSLPGRLLVRALPLDTGSRFWRATARSAPVAAAVKGADLLVAAERDGAFAAWRWHRRLGTDAPATVRGLAAARAWLSARASS